MTPSSDFPVKPSSGDTTKDGLTDPSKGPWKPDGGEKKPKVKVTVTEKDENVPVRFVTVSDTNTKNVKEVKVVVKDKDGNKVVSNTLLHRILDYV